MKSVLYFLGLTLLFNVCVYSQKTVERKTYYDYLETKVQRVWYELGDETFHGTTRYYKENGDLRWTKTYDRGSLMNYKMYFSDGQVWIEINYNKEEQYSGEQYHYRFEGGKRYLSEKVIVENNNLKYGECYYPNEKLRYKYSDNGVKKEFTHFDNNGNIYASIITSEGTVSDFSAYRLSVKNNTFGTIETNDFKMIENENSYTVLIINRDYYREFQNKVEGTFLKPQSQYFDLDTKFEYYVDANGTIHFGSNIILKEHEDKTVRFELELSNIYDLADYEKYRYAFEPIKNYLNHLDLGGLYTKIDSKQNKSEVFYENGQKGWTKNYWPNGKLKDSSEGGISKEFNLDGNLVKEYEGSKWYRDYNKNGQLIKEVEGDKFKVYNENGVIIDSDEIRVTYNQVYDEYNKLINEINLINEETNTIIENDFCIDVDNGEYLRVCFTKDNEFIWRAFKILHYEYLKSWKSYDETLDNATKKIPEGSLKWNSNIQFLEKIEYMQAYIVYFQSNIELIHDFNTTIGIFRDLLESPDIKKINKSLKKVTNVSEIKSIIDL